MSDASSRPRLLGPALFREYPFEEAYFLPLARQFRAGLKIPLFLLGGINTTAAIRQAMAEGFDFVAMGRALMSRPRLLLMDEPSMGLSPALVQQNFQIIKTIHASGVSVLMVEQNATMALSIADRGYVLSTGEIVLEGPAAELLSHEDLKRAYLGR